MNEQVTRGAAQPGPSDGRRGPEAPVEDGRPDVPPVLGRLAAWSWRLLVVLTAAGLLLFLLIQLKVIVVPVIVALFLATLLVPLVQALEARGWKHLPAVLAVFGGAVLLLVAIIAGFIPLISNELDTLRQRADEGVAEVQRYIASRPFGLSQADLNRYLDQARQRFTENSSGLTRGAIAGVTVAVVAGPWPRWSPWSPRASPPPSSWSPSPWPCPLPRWSPRSAPICAATRTSANPPTRENPNQRPAAGMRCKHEVVSQPLASRATQSVGAVL